MRAVYGCLACYALDSLTGIKDASSPTTRLGTRYNPTQEHQCHRFSIHARHALALAIATGLIAGVQAQGTAVGAPTAQVKHFDPKGTLPSKYTIELRKGVSATLPFEDKRDFDEAKKGFIAEPPFLKIMADAGNVAWDMGSYKWLLQGQ